MNRLGEEAGKVGGNQAVFFGPRFNSGRSRQQQHAERLALQMKRFHQERSGPQHVQFLIQLVQLARA